MKTKRKATKKQKIIALVGLVGVAVALILFITLGIPAIKENKDSAYNSKYKYDGISLVGKWQEDENFNDAFYKVYDYRADGKVVTSIYVYGIEAIRDELSTYRIEDTNTLVITYSVQGVIQNSETKFSISDDGETLVLRENGVNTVFKEYNLEYNKDSAIFGEWHDTSDASKTYTFNEDYTGKTSDGAVTNNIVFSTNSGKFYLFINENIIVEDNDYGLSEKYVIDYQYEIKDDILTLTAPDGSKTTYQRSK